MRWKGSDDTWIKNSRPNPRLPRLPAPDASRPHSEAASRPAARERGASCLTHSPRPFEEIKQQPNYLNDIAERTMVKRLSVCYAAAPKLRHLDSMPDGEHGRERTIFGKQQGRRPCFVER